MSGAINKDPKAMSLYNELFAHVLPQAPSTPLSDIGTGASLMVVDPAALGRATCDAVQYTLSQVDQTPSVMEASHILASPSMGVAYQLSGVPTAFHGLLTLLDMPSVYKGYAYARKIGDDRAAVKQGLNLAKHGIGATASLSLGGGFRATATASLVNGNTYSSFQVPTLLGRVSYGFLFVGLLLFTVFFGIIAVMSGISIYEGKKLGGKLEGKTAEEQIEILKTKLLGNPKKFNDPKELEKVALSAAAEGLTRLLEEAGLPALSKEELEVKVRELTQGQDLVAKGTEIRKQLLSVKKEGKLARLIGGDALKELKEIVAADTSDPKRVKALLTKVEGSLTNNTRMNAIGIVICIIAIASCVAATVAFGTVGMIISIVLMFLSSVAQLALDAYCFVKSLEQDLPTPQDKKMLVVSSLVSIAVVGVFVALTLSGVLSFGIVPLCILIGLTVLWLGHNSWTIYKIDQKEKKMHIERPTLETLFEAFEKAPDDAKKMLGHLSPELSGALQQQLVHQKNGNIKEATRALLFRIEKVRAERIESLRKALR